MKKHYKLKFGLLILAIFAFQSISAVNINVSDTINTNTTWNADTVKMTNDVIVADGVTLTISAGTYVQAQGHYKIEVKGTIIAQGTASNKITFTALSQSVGWKGMRFDNTLITNDTSRLKYCVFSYGNANVGSSNEKSGGGIFLYNFSKLVVENSLFSNNYAAYYGGAICCRTNASPRIINNVMVNNSSSSVGGAMLIYSSSNPILLNNTIAYNTSSNGGGLYMSSSFAGEVTNCIIYGNTANSSNQIYGTAYNFSYCDIEGGYTSGANIVDTIPGFVSPASGAGSSYDGLSADYSLLSTSALIDAGTNSVMNSGQINFDVDGNFRFDNSQIDIGAYEYISSTEVCGTIGSNATWSGNVLLNCNVIVSSGVTLTIQPGTKIISTGHYNIDVDGTLLAQGTNDNYIEMTAWDHNEGWLGLVFNNVSTTNDTSKVEYCKISYKKDLSSTYPNYYGAVFIAYSPKTIIRNNIISNNHSKYGAGITLRYTNAKVIGNLITNNQSYYYGGGLAIIGNSSYSSQITNNTISKNRSTNYSYAGGVYKSSTDLAVFKNNIIYGNEDNAGNNIAADNLYPTSGVNITYSCIEGGYTGTGNTSSAPLFKNPSPTAGIGVNINNYNFSLQATSPCIDAGDIATTGLSLPAYDLFGKIRKYSTKIDIGAYEDKSALSVCGTISADQTWDANIINVNCDVTIANGATVTIVPGTKVQFNGHYKLYVEGAIHAEGVEGDSIIFTAANTSVGWDGVQVYYTSNNNDSSLFSYCRFEYAKRVPSSSQLSGAALSVRSQKKTRVTYCRFANNEASGSNGYGGAMSLVYLHGDKDGRKYNHNVFEKNIGKNVVNLTYSNIEFKNNVLYSNTATSKAIIFVGSSGGDFFNNLISNNTSIYGALTIWSQYSDYFSYIYNNVIVNNEATYGGGMYVYDVKPEITNNTIANNYSSYNLGGGGIQLNQNADVIFKSNIIYGNKSLGGVSNQICIGNVAADPKFYNNDVEGGIVAFSGLGAGINYSGVFLNNIDASPTYASPTAGYGTSFDARSADWSLAQGSSLINTGFSNSAGLGLPVLDYAGNTRIYNGRIDMGAYENQQAIVSPCSISADTEWEADTVRITCDVTIASTKVLTIKEGTNVLFMGHYEIIVEGAIVAEGTEDNKINFLINDTTGFWDSTSTAGGWNGINYNSVIGAINDSSKFEYCTFTNAKAAGSSYQDRAGSVMNIYNTPDISIKNCIFANNFANYYGGALFIESSNIIFINNIVTNNTSGRYAGGIYFDDCTLDFLNNTVANNKAYSYGGMYARSSEITIKNSLFWGNKSYGYSNNYYSQLSFYSSTLSEIYNSNIQYGQNKIGYGNSLAIYQDNLDIDPEFINPAAGTGYEYNGLNANWGVSTSSPMLNQGMYGITSTPLDFDGNPRIVSDTLDIGAFEVQISYQFIDVQPTAKVICEGSQTALAAHASVNAAYQWQKDGVSIAGATNNILLKPTVALGDTGLYNCIISNAFGSVSTDTVTISVSVAPTVTTSPSSTNECLGSSVSFTADADGTSPVTYQWYNTSGSLQSGPSGTSAQAFTIGDDSIVNSANQYPAPFSNYYWGAKHQFLILASELTAMGVIAGDITSLGFDVDALNSCPSLSNFELKVGATSTTSMTTSWLSGLTSVYSVASYQPTNGWNNFGFTNAFSWDGTSNIVVEICTNNSSWLNNGNASVNQSATSFHSSLYYRADNATVCSYTGTGTRTAQRPNIKIVGQGASISTTSTYSINSISANDASNYYMIATNTCGSDQSSGATLGINYKPGLIAISAADDICEDGSYTYTAFTSQGTSPMTFQWMKDGDSITSATSLSYNITNADTADGGIYYCKAANMCGSDSTNQSILIVNEKPHISSQSSSQTVCENQSITFSITASGTAPITYQWYKGANPISGATNNTYTISSVSSTTDAATYYCKVINGCTSTPISSTGILLTVNTSPSISSQTGSVDVCAGSAAPFSITASGTATLTYQWFDVSGSISSATNNSYTISSASTSDAGNYYCVVTNTCGTANSNQIPLTVNSSPSITSQPTTLTKCENQSALFSVQAAGTATLAYQWYKGGSTISGANSSSLLISPIAVSDAANYYCKVTNSCGNVSSNSVALNVNSNVAITAQSSSQTLCEGSSPTLSVTTSGTSPITYQWYDDNGIITSATNSTYSIASIDTADAGNYYCIATNTCAIATSNSITLTVNEAPSIVTSPSSATVCENLSAVFTVSTNGTSPITYQWYNSSGAISGATASSYIIPQSNSSHIGNYYVKATNSCGTATSGNAALTVDNNVSITAQSSSQTVCDGSSPNFSITTSGTAPITYQWYKGNSLISGVTNNTYSLTSVDTSDAYSYYVIATNSCNSVQSNLISLTVNEAPSISSQPSSATICEGSSAQLSVSVSGTVPMTYQWYKSGSAIIGATSLNYLISSVLSSDASTYYVKATNSCGTVTSTSATLTVNNNVAITSQSSSQTLCDGASPTLSLTASGTGPITYSWYKAGNLISGATNNTYSLTSVDTSDAYTYYAIATNSCNSVQSNQISLTVNESPTITSQPSSSTVCSGSSAQLSVSVTGTSPLSYQWKKSGSTITGATNSIYLISQVSSTDASTYYVEITNSCGTATSNNAILTVNDPVAITSQTGDSTKCSGESITFSVSASGSSTISYQWYIGATAITGATASSYTIASIATSDGGDYHCVISNSCNSVTSNTMLLTVNSAPSISSQSSSATKCDGENISLSVNATGTNPLSYQWYDGNGIISGAISNVYAMYSLGASDAGTYHCIVSNGCGTSTSTNVVLTVNISPTITAQSSNTTVCDGSSTSLSVTASGTAPLTYQWYNSSGSISGATNNTFAISNADTSDADSYYCIVTNTCSSDQSQSIVLTVDEAPSIISQSTGATKCVGSSFSFNVSANGSAPLTYQWYDASGSILGATSALYLLNSLDTSDAGAYYCIVTNSCGTSQSTNKTLVINEAPTYTSQSSSLTKCETTSALFTVSAIGSNPLVYQWYADTGMVAGANANSYTIPSVSVANAGNYYCVVSNSCGTITSSTKTLTVNTSPIVITQSTDDTLCENMNAVMQLGTSGTSPMTYQWYKSSSAISGAISSYYTISSVDTNDAGTYYAIATNLCGTAQTNNISLSIDQLAAITFQSGDSSRCEGESMSFNVSTIGSGPIQYQWYKGTTAISGAHSNLHALTNVALSDAGYYSVNVSNMCNSTTSNYKLLSVHANPVVNLGNDTTFCDGGSITLTPGYGYQCNWSNGSYNNQINVTSTGSYFVNVMNQYGCQGASDTVNVNVILPYSSQSLCVVGVDTATNKNILVWEKTPNQGIESFNLYKESAVSNVWTLLGNIDYDSLSTFIDLTSTPNVKPERYAISVVDSCGNESAKSLSHRTMHLTVNAGQTANKWNLLWNSYEGFTPSTYRIYRADSTMHYVKLDSMAASSSYTYLWTDTAAPNGLVHYMVEIVHPTGGCSPTKANTNYNSSRSNTANNGIAPSTALVPDFIASQTHGAAPMIVQFYDQTSNGTVDTWFWNFGDGGNAAVQSPVHQYDSAGVYHVSLTVTNAYGSQSIIKTNFIDVLPNGTYSIHENFDVVVFPNPYRGSTNIAYSLVNSANVSIEVYSSLGKLVAVLADENQLPGSYKYSFNADQYGFAPGVYYLRMRLDDEIITKRLVEVK